MIQNRLLIAKILELVGELDNPSDFSILVSLLNHLYESAEADRRLEELLDELNLNTKEDTEEIRKISLDWDTKNGYNWDSLYTDFDNEKE